MKLLLIIPHMSTGGLPQVVLKRVESLIKEFDIYVIEYQYLSVSNIIQREKLINLLGEKFISMGHGYENKHKFKNYIDYIKPDIIHVEEIPELFLSKEHSDIIYSKNRYYKLFETTHTSTFNIENKKYFPDRFLFVSEYSKNEYEKFNIPIDVIEYPIDDLTKDKEKYMKELNMEEDYFHILNIGIFISNKNQKYLFEIAKEMLNYKVKFHFVGSLAKCFEQYWGNLIKNKTDNCVIWDEQDDVYRFYNACDMFFFPTLNELNPLVIKDALSYKMPIFMTDLDVYKNTYKNDNLITYLTFDINKDIKMLINKFNILKKYPDSSVFKKSLISSYTI